MGDLAVAGISPASDEMTEVIEFVHYDGTVTQINAQEDITLLPGIEGRGMPPMAHIEEEVPGQAGARHRFVKIGAREVGLPLLISNTASTSLRQRLRELLPRLDPRMGEGTLRVTAAGTQRELVCLYRGGLELTEAWFNRVTAMLIFRAAEDPYWRDTEDSTATFTLGEEGDPFFPIFPAILEESGIISDLTVDNEGDVEAWPVWTIRGPGTNPVLRHVTTGKALTLSTTLVAGDEVIIDTRPFQKTILKNGSTNLYSAMTSTSSMWPLEIGVQDVRVIMADSGIGSSVELAYRPRYLVS